MVARTLVSRSSMCTRNIVLGSASTISPSTSIFSSFWAIYLTETALAVDPLQRQRPVPLGRRGPALAPPEPQPDAGPLGAAVDRRELRECDRPRGRVLEWRVEELSAGDVRAARVDEARPACEAERQ